MIEATFIVAVLLGTGYVIGRMHGVEIGWEECHRLHMKFTLIRFTPVPDTAPDGSPLSYSTVEDLTK